MDAGLDSLGAVELRNNLASTFGLDLPATLTFDHPTLAAIAAHIHVQISATRAAGQMAIPSAVARHDAAVLEIEISEMVSSVLGKAISRDEVLCPDSNNSRAIYEVWAAGCLFDC